MGAGKLSPEQKRTIEKVLEVCQEQDPEFTCQILVGICIAESSCIRTKYRNESNGLISHGLFMFLAWIAKAHDKNGIIQNLGYLYRVRESTLLAIDRVGMCLKKLKSLRYAVECFHRGERVAFRLKRNKTKTKYAQSVLSGIKYSYYWRY